MRLGDTMAELEAEREKIEAGKRRQEHLRRAHDADQITVFDIARMQDFDEGDQGTVERLARRAEGLRKQIGEAQGMITPARGRLTEPREARGGGGGGAGGGGAGGNWAPGYGELLSVAASPHWDEIKT